MKRLLIGLGIFLSLCTLPQQAYAEEATVAIKLALHGISTTGDSINPGNEGPAPMHNIRSIMLTFSDIDNKQQSEQTTTVTFDTTTNLFVGTLTIPDIKPGRYIIKVAMAGALPRSWAPVTINANTTTTLDTMTLLNGDINEDKAINLQDYNILLNCFGEKQYTASCTHAPVTNRVGADLTDDGAVDGLDYNLLLRELISQPTT